VMLILFTTVSGRHPSGFFHHLQDKRANLDAADNVGKHKGELVTGDSHWLSVRIDPKPTQTNQRDLQTTAAVYPAIATPFCSHASGVRPTMRQTY
jgi:hypothetical protein